ncbi:MAG: phage portal protein [Clostridia bacterium]|jgi:SPP1 family phage portal protein|nr:phage portal protein [Clostridia bacterium]
MIQISNLVDIKEDDIYKLVDMIEPELNSRKQLWKRIHRKTKLCNIVFSLNGKKENITFEKYIWLIASGFLGGKAPVYTVNDTVDKEKIKIIKELFDKEITDKNYKKKMEIVIDFVTRFNDDEVEHYNLMCDALGLRGCYELIYENENNEIVYSKLDPMQTVAIWDYNVPRNLLGFVRIVKEKNVNSTSRKVVEITDINGTRKYATDGQVFNEDEKKNIDRYIELKTEYENHNWGDVPGFAIETDESIFESIVDTVLKYEKLIKNTSNMFEYNDELAKLAVYGYSPENEMVIQEQYTDDKGETQTRDVLNPAREVEDENVRKSKTLYFPDKNNGGAEWVLKEINDSGIQNTLKTYIDLILMMAGVPNTFDLGFTNADNASAIDRKFFSLMMMTINLIQQFKMGYKRRWELIFNRINLKKGTNFDFRDVSIDLPANLPANESEVIDMWLKLRGLASDETITERLPLGLDYTSEKNKIETQNQENMQNNIKNMQILGSEQNGQDMGLPQFQNKGIKTNISKNKQTDTKQPADDIQNFKSK